MAVSYEPRVKMAGGNSWIVFRFRYATQPEAEAALKLWTEDWESVVQAEIYPSGNSATGRWDFKKSRTIVL